MLMIQRWIGIGILSLLALPLMAQKGLQVNTLFDGRFKKDHRAVEVLIKGKELKKYHLSLFRSLTVTNAPAVFREMETLVCQDAKSAVDKEVGNNREPSVLWLLLFFGRRRNFQIPLLPQHFRKARKRKAAGGYSRLHGGASHPGRTQTIISIRITINTDSI